MQGDWAASDLIYHQRAVYDPFVGSRYTLRVGILYSTEQLPVEVGRYIPRLGVCAPNWTVY